MEHSCGVLAPHCRIMNQVLSEESDSLTRPEPTQESHPGETLGVTVSLKTLPWVSQGPGTENSACIQCLKAESPSWGISLPTGPPQLWGWGVAAARGLGAPLREEVLPPITLEGHSTRADLARSFQQQKGEGCVPNQLSLSPRGAWGSGMGLLPCEHPQGTLLWSRSSERTQLFMGYSNPPEVSNLY